MNLTGAQRNTLLEARVIINSLLDAHPCKPVEQWSVHRYGGRTGDFTYRCVVTTDDKNRAERVYAKIANSICRGRVELRFGSQVRKYATESVSWSR